MNDQLSSDVKAVFDDIVARTPPLGELDNSDVIEISSFEQARDPRRWTLPVAAALMLVTVGVIVVLSTRRDGATPAPVATDPVTPTVETDAPDTTIDDTVTVPDTVVATTLASADPTTAATSVPVASLSSTPASTLVGSVPAGSKTVLAFSDGGSSVQIAPGSTTPTPLFDYAALNSYWEMIDYSPTYGVGFIGTCCEPAVGAVYKIWMSDDQAAPDSPYNGYGVSISPNDRFVAIGDVIDNPVSIRDLANNGEVVQSDPAPGWGDIAVGDFTPSDVMWMDDQRLVVLGSTFTDPNANSPEYVLYEVMIDADGRITSVSEAIPTGHSSDLAHPMQFAGRTEPDNPGQVALHERGTAEVFFFDMASQQEVIVGVDRDLLSVWYDPGFHIVSVDMDGVLNVDGATIAGTYAWARTT